MNLKEFSTKELTDELFDEGRKLEYRKTLSGEDEVDILSYKGGYQSVPFSKIKEVQLARITTE